MSKLIIHNKSKDRTLHLSGLDGTFDDVIRSFGNGNLIMKHYALKVNGVSSI